MAGKLLLLITLKLDPRSQGAEAEAALAFAITDDTAPPEVFVQDLTKRSPLDRPTVALRYLRSQFATASGQNRTEVPIVLCRNDFVDNGAERSPEGFA
jgi:hypothetical protein